MKIRSNVSVTKVIAYMFLMQASLRQSGSSQQNIHETLCFAFETNRMLVLKANPFFNSQHHILTPNSRKSEDFFPRLQLAERHK